MRVLVTGGNGYVGRALVRHLYADHEVAVVDMLRNGGVRFRPDELSRFRFDQVDIRDVDALNAVVADFAPEITVHLAAIHFIPECELHPDEAASINTIGTANLLRAVPAASRFVFASTAAVYTPATRPHHELTSPIGPTDVYGLTKRHAEEYVEYYAKKRSLDARIVRLFNVVGPGETNPHILPALLAQVLRGQDTLRLGNVRPERDYVNVADVARGFAAVAFGDRAVPEGEVDVVNIGTGDAYSVADLVRRLGRVFDRPLTIDTDPARVRASDRPYLAAATERMHAHYGWTATMDIDETLRGLAADPDMPASLLEQS